MLWCVYGNPGACKTLLGGIADGVIPAIVAHRRIFTNITGIERKIARLVELTGVPATSIDIVKLTNDRNEILTQILDTLDNKENNGSIWILDEIRELFLANKKFNEWLSLRLNYMRKNRQDLIFIAQLPSYIDDDIKALADGSSFFVRLFKYGIKGTTAEFIYNSGEPRLDRRKKPVEPDGYRRRKVDERYFGTYISAIDEATDRTKENNRSASFWTSPKMKIFYASAVAFVLVVLCALWVFKSVIGTATSLAFRRGGGEVVESSSSESVFDLLSSSSIAVNPADSLCYLSKFVIGGKVKYKMENGVIRYANELDYMPNDCRASLRTR